MWDTRLDFALNPNSVSLQISIQLYGGVTTDQDQADLVSCREAARSRKLKRILEPLQLTRGPDGFVQPDTEGHVSALIQQPQQTLDFPAALTGIIGIFILNPVNGRASLFQATQLVLIGRVEAAVDCQRLWTGKVKVALARAETPC
jgi:hypothetical protein